MYWKFIHLNLLLLASFSLYAQQNLNTPQVESILYLNKSQNQPLVVGLGGSEGGNAWASDYWKPTRDKFLEIGYAFLSIGYFGAKGTPKQLDRIAIEDVFNAIEEALKNEYVDKNKIAIIGGSKGADLALLLGSYYNRNSAVVAIVPSHAVFAGHTNHFTTSCFTFQNEELPFIPVNKEAIPFLWKRDLRAAFETMLKDTVSEEKALIRVENISGPILLLSATKDEVCPSTPMSDKIVSRLVDKKFKHHFEHIAIEGGHTEPLKNFDLIFNFLQKHFNPKKII